MSERTPPRFEEPSRNEAVSEKMAQLLTELESQATHPPRQDFYRATFSIAMNKILSGSRPDMIDREIRTEISDILTSKDEKPSAFVGHLSHAFQNQFMDEPDYPRAYGVQRWKQQIRSIFTEEAESNLITRKDTFRTNVYTPVMTNIANRFQYIPMIARAQNDRWPHRLNIFNVGCSRNNELTHLAMGLPYGKVRALKRTVGEESDNALELDPLYSVELNRLLGRAKILEYGVGVDIWPLEDETAKRWARACRPSPYELLDESLLRRYDALERAQPMNVGFQRADFILDDEQHPVFNLGRDKGWNPDMVVFNTVLHQHSSEDVAVALQRAARMLTRTEPVPGQIRRIFIGDFVKANATVPNGLEFIEHWWDESLPYRVISIDPFDLSAEPEEILRYTDSRLTEVEVVAGTDFERSLKRNL